MPDSGNGGSWSFVVFCWVYNDEGAGRDVCGGERLLDLDVSLCLLPLVLDVVLRASLSLVRRGRTKASVVLYS